MTKARTWFVTGTDTNAGKTCVAQALLNGAQELGLRASGYKPIESGASCISEGGPDAQALAAAATLGEIQTSYVFEHPIAPLQAARLAGKTINFKPITARTNALQHTNDLLIVEGAGGLLVPVAPALTIAELALAIGEPILIVAANALGAINHSLLTIEAARSRGLKVLALILSQREPGGGQGLGNREQIEEYGKVPVLEFAHAQNEMQRRNFGTQLVKALLLLDQ